jgi:predicted Ser/Thr protein kinase
MIGKTIGRYRIDAELGRGGMGVVYRATQMNLDRTVAIKMLSPQLAESREHLARFRREAEVLARLQHENIVHIYDVEEVAGSFCIVMEYVAGPSLGQLLSREGVLAPGTVRDVAVQLTAGLDAAHRKGIVHRDLKPDNILFTPEGRPRITDFGIARITGGDAMARTRTGILMGTPYYMSPEQAGGREVTGASDLYSLGILLYQMLSGRVPFRGTDPISLAIKHIQEPPPPLDSTMPGLPGALVGVVARALEKEPHRRFASAAEMGATLRTLELEAVDLPLLGYGAGGGGEAMPGATPCPECGFRVHAAFVTCPQCALPLRAGPERAADSDAGPGRDSVPGPTSAPVQDPAPAESAPSVPPRPAAAAAGMAASGGGAGGRGGRGGGGLADGGLAGWLAPLRPTLEALHDTTAAWGSRIAFPRSGADWVQPRGRWGIPPVLWAGVGILALGLGIGLLGGGAHGAGSGSAVPVSGGSGGPTLLSDGTTRPFAGGGGTFLPTDGSLRPGGGGGEGGEDGGGAGGGDGARGEGGGGEGDAGGAGDNAGRDSDDLPGTPADWADADGAAPEGDRGDATDRVDADGDDARPADTDEPEAPAPFPTFDDTEGYENLPAGFDIERARREIVGIVERQRRATESGDRVEFTGDLSQELALEAVEDLADLHDAYHSIRSEVRNVRIYFEDATRARVDFHTWLSGTPRSGGPHVEMNDVHIYWTLAYRSGRWIIVGAEAERHESEEDQ